MKRTCKKCGVEKDIDEFWRDRTSNSGYDAICKKCKNKAAYIFCVECVVCGCFFLAKKQHVNNGVKHCNRYCMAIGMKGVPRPKHVMEIMKKTWIKKGQRLSKKTEFKKGKKAKNSHSFPKGNIAWNDSKTYIKCDFCGEKIKITPSSKTGKNKFCSVLCMGKHYDKGGVKADRKELRGPYIKHCIIQNSNLKFKDIPQSFVDLHREKLKIYRFLKEQAS